MTKPKRQHPANRKRADRAKALLVAGKYWDCGESYAVADILSDLRHLCDREKWNFEDLNESGFEHYRCEVTPDDIEQDSRRLDRQDKARKFAPGERIRVKTIAPQIGALGTVEGYDSLGWLCVRFDGRDSAVQVNRDSVELDKGD